MRTIELKWDEDTYAPFYRNGDDGYICLSELNNHFDPPIPGHDDEVGESDDTLPERIWVCTAKTLPDRAWYGGFKLLRDRPGVEAFHDGEPWWNCAGGLSPLISLHLMGCYRAGDRWAWIEYEVRS